MRSTILLGIVATAQASNSDVVEALPGLDIPVSQCWKSYTGYLDVEAGTKALFHWYHEAVDDAASKPLVLWLNGGPGCSSLGGMFTELGPYVLDAAGAVTLNPYSWNTVANVLFIEQPAGVGFSYPNATIDDATTASDTYEALVAFFAAHPELEGRDFYVAGESYGGHYVPNTAAAVEAGNAALEDGAALINLKGFMVGNGYCDWQLDFNANVENGRYHALTSQADFEAAQTSCGGDYARCFWPRDDVHCPAACGDAVEKTTKWAMDGSIDIYDIYEDVCLDADQERLKTQAFVLEAERRSRRADGRLGATTISPVFPTCADTYVKKYLGPGRAEARHEVVRQRVVRAAEQPRRRRPGEVRRGARERSRVGVAVVGRDGPPGEGPVVDGVVRRGPGARAEVGGERAVDRRVPVGARADGRVDGQQRHLELEDERAVPGLELRPKVGLVAPVVRRRDGVLHDQRVVVPEARAVERRAVGGAHRLHGPHGIHDAVPLVIR